MGPRAVVGCTKVTDIWSEFARSINRGSGAVVGCVFSCRANARA
jgi:hypothetical protein